MRKHMYYKMICLMLLCAFASMPLTGLGQEVERVASSGAARGAAASAGCGVHECATMQNVVGAAFIAAGTGAVIAMAPEVMGISAGVAALGLAGFAGVEAARKANSKPRGADQVPPKPLEAGIADQSSKSDR